MTRAWTLILATPLALAACDGPSTKVKIDARDGSGNSAVIIENGTVAIKAEGFEGSMKLPKIALDAEDFEVNGLRLYPGSTVREFNLNAEEKPGKDKGEVRIGFESPAPLATVRSWFGQELGKHGFKAEAKGEGFVGTTRDGDSFTLALAGEGEEKTRGTMEIGS